MFEKDIDSAKQSYIQSMIWCELSKTMFILSYGNIYFGPMIVGRIDGFDRIEGAFEKMAISSDGATIVASSKSRIIILDAITKSVVREFEANVVSSKVREYIMKIRSDMYLNEPGNTLTEVQIMNLVDLELRKECFDTIELLEDAKEIFVSNKFGWQILDLEGGSQGTPKAISEEFSALGLFTYLPFPDGKSVLVYNVQGGPVILDKDGAFVAQLKGVNVSSAVWNLNFDELICGTYEGEFLSLKFELPDFKIRIIARFEDQYTPSIKVSSDGKLFMATSLSEGLCLYDFETGAVLASYRQSESSKYFPVIKRSFDWVSESCLVVLATSDFDTDIWKISL